MSQHMNVWLLSQLSGYNIANIAVNVYHMLIAVTGQTGF